MKRISVSIGILAFANLLSSVALAQPCLPENEGKLSCVSAETMKCVKKFDPASKITIFELEAVTQSGQTIPVTSPLYKKTLGYSPKPCATPS